MKKYRIYLLALTVLALFVSAFSQVKTEKNAQKPTVVESLQVKRQTEALNKQRLRQLMSAVGVSVEDAVGRTSTRAYQAIKIRLPHAAKQTTSTTSQDEVLASPVVATIFEKQTRTGSLPRQRSLELSTDHLLVATVDAEARLRWFSLIPDPRILRIEVPGPDDQLSGQVVYQQSSDFVLNVPDDEEVTELRFYHPRWTGDQFALVLISTIPMPKN